MSFIIAFGGEKAVGKDTAAQVLVEKYGFVRCAFADPLKEMCAFALCMSLAKMHDPLLKDKPGQLPITIYPHHVNRMADYAGERGYVLSKEQRQGLMRTLAWRSFATPRQMLQYVGTEGFRKSVADDFWISLFKKSVEGKDKVVVTDMRFPNEREAVTSLGGKTIRIKRPRPENEEVHASEKSLGEDSEYSVVMVNDGTINHLHEVVLNWWNAKETVRDSA